MSFTTYVPTEPSTELCTLSALNKYLLNQCAKELIPNLSEVGKDPE